MATFAQIIEDLKAVTADLEEAAAQVALGTYTVGEPPEEPTVEPAKSDKDTKK